MSMTIAWNLDDCVLLSCDHRHTEYYLNGMSIKNHFDIPDSKIKLIGKEYVYSLGGLTLPCQYVERGLRNVDEKISVNELLELITSLCKKAHDELIKEYGNIQINGFKSVGLFLATYDRYWKFEQDKNFIPIEYTEKFFASVFSAGEADNATKIMEKLSCTCKSYEEVLIKTFLETSKAIKEISPTCDIYRIAEDGITKVNIVRPVKAALTSRTIKTASSGERIEISNNQLKTYNSSNAKNGFCIEKYNNVYSGLIYEDNSILGGMVNFNDGGLSIYANASTNKNLYLAANGDTARVDIKAGGQIRLISGGSVLLPSNTYVGSVNEDNSIATLNDLSGFVSKSYVDNNFANINHNHGNSYIKNRTTSDNISISATEFGIIVRKGEEILGQINYD